MTTPAQLVNNTANTSVDTPEIFYTAPLGGGGTIIKQFTASNTGSVSASYRAYIVSSTGSATNPQVPFQIVVWGENDFGQGVTNHIIPAGGSLRMESSSTNRIYFTVSGEEL